MGPGWEHLELESCRTTFVILLVEPHVHCASRASISIQAPSSHPIEFAVHPIRNLLQPPILLRILGGPRIRTLPSNGPSTPGPSSQSSGHSSSSWIRSGPTWVSGPMGELSNTMKPVRPLSSSSHTLPRSPQVALPRTRRRTGLGHLQDTCSSLYST